MKTTCPHPRPTAETCASMSALLYFVWEREAIRLARAAEFPRERWTADPIFARYKFTNIRRRDDRVSRWIIREMIEPAVDCGDEQLWFTLLVARLINWPPSLEALLGGGVLPVAPGDFSRRRFVEVLEARKAAGAKVYSGAYMLYPTKMDPGGCKSEAVARYIIGAAVERAADIAEAVFPASGVTSVEGIVRELSLCFGVSSFMAGQVAADLTYTGMTFSDVYTWAPIGPGSAQGLNALLERSKFAGWAQADFNRELIAIKGRIESELGIRGLTLHDVQNVMCEYSKYVRALRGEGKPKTLYKPETEF